MANKKVKSNKEKLEEVNEKLANVDKEKKELTKRRAKIKADILAEHNKEAGTAIRQLVKKWNITFDESISWIDSLEPNDDELFKAIKDYQQSCGVSAHEMAEKINANLKNEVTEDGENYPF